MRERREQRRKKEESHTLKQTKIHNIYTSLFQLVCLNYVIMYIHVHVHVVSASHMLPHVTSDLSSFSIAACSSGKVVLGSRVKLAVRPSDDVTLIFFLAGFPGVGEGGEG